jgi:hypothetical protein
MMDFCNTHVFSMKKVGKSENFADGGTINHKTHHNSLCRDKNRHWVTSYVIFYKAVSHVMLSCMWGSPQPLH